MRISRRDHIPRGGPNEDTTHRKLPLTIVTAAVASATPPTNKDDCEKAKMKWDEKGGKGGKGACIAAAPTAQPPKK